MSSKYVSLLLLGAFALVAAATTSHTLAAQAAALGTCQNNRKAIVRNEPGTRKVVYSLEAHIAIPIDATSAQSFELARRCLTEFDPDPAKRVALRKSLKDALLDNPICPRIAAAGATRDAVTRALDDFVSNDSSRWVVRAFIDNNASGIVRVVELSAEIEFHAATDARAVEQVADEWHIIEDLLSTTEGLANLKEPLKAKVTKRLNDGAPGAAQFFGL